MTPCLSNTPSPQDFLISGVLASSALAVSSSISSFLLSFPLINSDYGLNVSFSLPRYRDLSLSRPKAGESLSNTSENFATWTKTITLGKCGMLSYEVKTG